MPFDYFLIFFIFHNNQQLLNPMINHMKPRKFRQLSIRKYSTLILQKYGDDKVGNFQENIQAESQSRHYPVNCKVQKAVTFARFVFVFR